MKRTQIIVLVLGAATGCAGLIGVPDLTFDEGASQGNPDSSSGGIDSSSGGTDTGGLPDGGGTDSSPPCDETKLATDPKHCGRCGHDCLGGACNAGKCAPVILESGLTNPTDLVVDATNIYVSCRGGTILRKKKDGSAPPDVLAMGHTKATGVALDNQTLYWSNLDFDGDGGNGYWGGVWKCTLPSCNTSTSLVTIANFAANVRFSAGKLYFAEANNSAVIAVGTDGNGRIEIANPTQPYTVSVDGQHVYYVANAPNFRRVQLDGGGDESVGPLGVGSTLGHTTVDGERVYWAYADDTTNKGHVYSASKANPALPKIEYGTANVASIGVAVDVTSVFWTNEGSFTNVYQPDGDVLTCPKTGCVGAPTVIADKIVSPGAIVVDGAALYFVTFGAKVDTADGVLYRVAKP